MLTFEFTGVDGRMTESETLTSGMVGKTVQILFDESWDSLSKTVVFRCDGICRTADGSLSPVTIPEDVLARPFRKLHVGVYGIDETGALVIPTVMAEGPMIRYGANPTEDSTAEDLPVLQRFQAQIGNLADLETDAKENLVAAINEVCSQGGSGLSETAAGLLIEILRHGVFETNQQANIDALESALFPDGEDSGSGSDTPAEPDEPEITLTGITVTYSGGDVPAGTSVADLTGLTVTAHHSDGSTKTVTSYTVSGIIAEGSNTLGVSYEGKSATFTVTGTATASGTPEEEALIHYWDFTQSLTDSIGGVTLTTSNTTQDANGLHFNSANSLAKTGLDITGKTVEVEFGPAEKQGTGHGRCVTTYMVADADAPSYGILWHSTGKWATYNLGNNGWKDGENTDANAISQGILRIPFKKDEATFDILLNGNVFLSGEKMPANYKYLYLGSGNTAYYNMTIKKLKIYEGA